MIDLFLYPPPLDLHSSFTFPCYPAHHEGRRGTSSRGGNCFVSLPRGRRLQHGKEGSFLQLLCAPYHRRYGGNSGAPVGIQNIRWAAQCDGPGLCRGSGELEGTELDDLGQRKCVRGGLYPMYLVRFTTFEPQQAAGHFGEYCLPTLFLHGSSSFHILIDCTSTPQTAFESPMVSCTDMAAGKPNAAAGAKVCIDADICCACQRLGLLSPHCLAHND